MALLLIYLVRHKINGYVHIEDFLKENKYPRCGDFSFLRYYRFLEPLKASRLDGSKKNGYYRITALGIMFSENKITAKENFITFNGKCEGFEGEEINVIQALGKKFDYKKLMDF